MGRSPSIPPLYDPIYFEKSTQWICLEDLKTAINTRSFC
jgi:hypothetical protein